MDKANNGLSQYQNLSSVTDFAPELWVKDNTFKGSFSDDFNTFYFFGKVAPTIEKYVPYQSIFVDGKWQEPQKATYYNKGNSYTYQLKVPNSDELFLLSNKRTKTDTSATPNYNFWKTKWIDNRYTELIEFKNNDLIYNYNSQPCITENGTLYFTSDLPDWSKTLSYKMKFDGTTYAEPELFEPVNKWRESEDWNVFEYCISPKEGYMIVCIQDNTLPTPSADLYISFFKDTTWSYPRRLDDGINTPEAENFPTITKDGAYLIFTRGFSEFKIIPTQKLMGKT